MKKTVKLFSVLLAVAVIFSFAACGSKTDASSDASSDDSSSVTEPVTVNFAALKGPTGIGAVNIVNKSSDTDSVKYTSTLYGDPTDVVAEAVKGSVDIAAVPTNSAAAIYKKTDGAYQALCLNTLGTLYIVENGETIKSLSDLEGKTIYATGEGATPQYVLEYLLKENNINCKIEYLTEHSELATKAISGDVKLALLPQPFVTQVTVKNADVRIALNLTDEWDSVAKAKNDGSVLTMGCFIVRKAFAQEHPEAVAAFLKSFGESVEYVNNNVAEASEKVVEAGIMDGAAVIAKAIPNCNMVCVSGDEMKTELSGFLQVLFNANASSVGGAMPEDDFYYVGK